MNEQFCPVYAFSVLCLDATYWNRDGVLFDFWGNISPGKLQQEYAFLELCILQILSR